MGAPTCRTFELLTLLYLLLSWFTLAFFVYRVGLGFFLGGFLRSSIWSFFLWTGGGVGECIGESSIFRYFLLSSRRSGRGGLSFFLLSFLVYISRAENNWVSFSSFSFFLCFLWKGQGREGGGYLRISFFFFFLLGYWMGGPFLFSFFSFLSHIVFGC